MPLPPARGRRNQSLPPAHYDDLVKVERETGRQAWDEFYRELNNDKTPEELIAGHYVLSHSGMEMADPGNPDGDWWAQISWPWGDARGRLKVKGRTYLEAKLRLRDAVVRSARDVGIKT